MKTVPLRKIGFGKHVVYRGVTCIKVHRKDSLHYPRYIRFGLKDYGSLLVNLKNGSLYNVNTDQQVIPVLSNIKG